MGVWLRDVRAPASSLGAPRRPSEALRDDDLPLGVGGNPQRLLAVPAVVITRIWHGWTTQASADAYESLLRAEILPGIHRVPGYLGATLLRREAGEEVEFVTLTRFESLDAVRAFAGADYEQAVVPDAARALLTRFDERSAHYETVLERT